ncbi:MAG: sensor histidine kinase [Nitrospirae bacterium]|nr:MAG: sensor histidine kinase [Nitrospirota bacterium]
MFARLSIFWRLALGYIAVLALVVAVNLYILNQLRVLTELGAELATYHFPAVETAKRLISSLYSQLKSDKQYLVLRDTALLKEFLQEAENFRKTLTALLEQETSQKARDLLERTRQLHEEFQTLFLSKGVEQSDRSPAALADYENRRDVLIDAMTEAINAYISFQEASVGGILSESHLRSVRAEAITRQLMMAALLLGLGLAGVASYSILRPIRRVQDQIKRIGQGQFGRPIPVTVPNELRELVETVNWMGTKLQQLDQMKSEFLANISHELRTPLTSIREGTQLLLDGIPGPLTKDQRETLTILLESSQQLNRLIGNLLDLSRMEADMLAYHFATTDLNRLIQRAVDKMRFLAERKGVKLLTELTDDRARLQEVDGPRIEQVLENLLSNAVKFSPSGAIVTVRSEPHNHGLHIAVTDTGPGIGEDDLPHVFERFYQGKSPESRAYVGSGIGLHLAKRVIEAHGGKIWAESEVGKGTIMHIVIPNRKKSSTDKTMARNG